MLKLQTAKLYQTIYLKMHPVHQVLKLEKNQVLHHLIGSSSFHISQNMSSIFKNENILKMCLFTAGLIRYWTVAC